MATSQETLDKWKEQGFEPTQRALDADKWIDSRNPQDHPDEFTFVGSMGYVYTGPARFYTTGSEHTAWLNSKLGENPYETAYDVARMVDNHPAIPKASTGLFAPLESYEPPSRPPPMGQQPQSPLPPMGQQIAPNPMNSSRPNWSALNPMNGMLTSFPAIGAPMGIPFINQMLGKRYG